MYDLGPHGFGLAGSVAYGFGDFAGGWAARRLAAVQVIAIGSAVSAALSLYIALPSLSVGALASLLTAEFAPRAVAGGLCHTLGIGFLYAGLAAGRVSVVAPVAGISNILVATLLDVTFVGPVGHSEFFGVGVAVVAVLLISATVGEQPSASSSGARSLACGLASGVCFGCADAVLGAMPPEWSIHALAIARTSSAGIALAVVVGIVMSKPPAISPEPRSATRRIWLLPSIGLSAAAGLLDCVGQGSFVISATLGSISTASALTSLYPGVSVLLGILVFGERLSRVQITGLAMGGLCIVLLD